MKRISIPEDIGYKYIIALKPEEAKVLKTSLDYLPSHAKNTEEIQSIIKAVSDVAELKTANTIYGDDNPNCVVCDD